MIKICRGCGKLVEQRNPLHSKYLKRHKCPHGRWCLCGETNIGMHNNQSGCPECDTLENQIKIKEKMRER